VNRVSKASTILWPTDDRLRRILDRMALLASLLAFIANPALNGQQGSAGAADLLVT
jgi:hypothetical protein